jgi:ribonuclease HI
LRHDDCVDACAPHVSPRVDALPTDCWVGYSDGAAKPNPGAMGAGILLVAPNGDVVSRSLTPGTGCNTEAEAHALLAALKLAQQLQVNALCMHVDNVALVHHTAGPGRTRVQRLDVVYRLIQHEITAFERFELRWVARTHLAAADALARAALGLTPRPPVRRARG